ncbi:2-amino-4-deoxychorismate dehydrogenase [Anaerohalosphaera lusitana]|uniref:2-amino-4-deoxychorismate dehydrogenase n=1 Tax=Anaerohalosphaera lusitana TaxID=1936003 RepID=A0A1U9NPL4_9BACT|nr:flavodoxin family protein [Anaerohalosphaera lusitana]AQT69550.1 2-amino-4-deoxychorismate dehydrogenase [Anaerohalosphaera lusitana]
MKVLGINGSPRKGGNTEIMMRKVFEPLEKAGIDTELVQIGGKPMRGCTACGKCREMQNGTCVITNDALNDILAKMREADGIVLGSPTYFADVTAEMKALIDRAGYVSKNNGGQLQRKVGVAVAAVRRGGSIHAFDSMNHFFQISGMFIVGSTYWNMCYGREVGEVENDEEGIANMADIGESMAFLLEKLAK